MIHMLIALGYCVLITVVFQQLVILIWPIYLWPALFYLGRELAQAEYRYIQAHGGKRANVPWYCAIYPSAWTAKSLFDWLLPLTVTVVFAIVLFFYAKSHGL